MFTKLVGSLVVLLVVVDCSPHKLSDDKQCVPMKFEGNLLGRLIIDYNGVGLTNIIFASFSVDYDKKIEVYKESKYEVDGTFINNFTVYHTEDTRYRVDPVLKTCEKLPSIRPAERICYDPKYMTRVGTVIVAGQLADVYFTKTPIGSITRTIFRENFMIFNEILEFHDAEMPGVRIDDIGNVKLGIEDPKVFDIPSYCPKN